MAVRPTVEFIDLRALSATPSTHLLLALAEALPPHRQAALTAATGLPNVAQALVALVMVSALGWLVTVDGQPIAALGCTPLPADNDAGGFWLLETETVKRQPPVYLRRIRKRLADAQAVHPVLITEVSADDSDARRRLRLLGFTFASYRADDAAPFPTCQYRRAA